MLLADQIRSILALIVVGCILTAAIFQDQIFHLDEYAAAPAASPTPAGPGDKGPGGSVALLEPAVAEAALPGDTAGPCADEESFRAREASLAEGEAALGERDARLREWENELARREGAVASREEWLSRESQAVQDEKQQLSEQQDDLDTLGAELDRRGSELDEREARLLERERRAEEALLTAIVLGGVACLTAAGALVWLALGGRTGRDSRRAGGRARQTGATRRGERLQPAVLRPIGRRPE